MKPIIEQAYKYIRDKKREGKKTKKPDPDVLKVVNRIRWYKKKTGKKRLAPETKSALVEFTGSQVLSAQKNKNIDKLVNKRFGQFWSKYGYAFDNTDIDEIKYQLKYISSEQLAKKWGLEKEPPRPPEDWEEKTFLPVTTPAVNWEVLKRTVGNVWSHKSGNFLYENGKLWDESWGNEILSHVLDNGENAKDHTVKEFLEEVVPDVDSDLYFIGKGDDFILVKKDEYDFFIEQRDKGQAKLSDDFYTSRKYFVKKKLTEDEQEMFDLLDQANKAWEAMYKGHDRFLMS